MSIFKFKNFNVIQTNAPQKVGTDAMVLGALVNHENTSSILDVGTGCGVIALMLAQNYPKAKVTGLDIDEKAALQAQSNFQNSHFPNEFEALHQNFLEYILSQKFDLIVSNPPYFNTKMPSIDQQRSLARHENSMSLQDLINHSERLLTENGALWMIVPSERAEALINDDLNLKLSQRIKIYGKPNRHVRDVLVFTKTQNEIDYRLSELTIRDDKNQYTEQYKALTLEFHYNKL